MFVTAGRLWIALQISLIYEVIVYLSG